MPKIICITGKAGSGKDTAANYIKKVLESDGYSVLVTHYADLLKFITRNYFEWNERKDASGRELLQRVGTEIFRRDNPNYWIEFIHNIIRLLPDRWDYVVIADTRYINEVSYWKESGYECRLLKIKADFKHDKIWERDHKLTEEQKQHSSEKELEQIEADIEINNNETLQDFHNNLDLFIRNI